MDLFRWRRTLLRALGPALACATLAGWGVYVLTADERPTYRSSALLNTGIMAAHEAAGGSYVRDVVINELEGIMNLARSQETREELAARLLADFLALDGPHPEVVSPRAYGDLRRELDPALVERHTAGGRRDAEAVYASVVAERDSLLRYGEASADHPLIELLYGDDPLVGAEQLATLRVNRKGLSDILELSYATVDAAWCKHTLDRHLEVFLRAHREASQRRRSNALAYFRRATDESRARLAEVEEELRRFATRNKIINYYEQTRYIASVKNQVDQRFTEESMKEAAADSSLTSLEERLAKRTDLIRLNNLVDDRRRRLGELSREEARLEIMAADSAAGPTELRLGAVRAEMAGLRQNLTADVVGLGIVHGGPEGLELGRLITEWLSATLALEQARGRLQVLEDRKIDFDKIYTRMAGLGSRLKQLEREGDVAEEDYLERLRALNNALQREHSSSSNTDVRLLDAPVFPTKPEKSKRLLLVAVGALVGGGLPVVVAIALMLMSGALLSFAEAHRRTGLTVVGGVARWGLLSRYLRRRSAPFVAATSADLLWQNLRSTSAEAPAREPRLVAVTSLRPGAGKSYGVELLAARLTARGLRVLAVGGARAPAVVAEEGDRLPAPTFDVAEADPATALASVTEPAELLGLSPVQWRGYDVVFWELPALGTGRLPVDLARRAADALLVHPAASGWSEADATALGQLADALGGPPRLVLNGLDLAVLLHEWGASLRELRAWGGGEAAGAVGRGELPRDGSVGAVAASRRPPDRQNTPPPPPDPDVAAAAPPPPTIAPRPASPPADIARHPRPARFALPEEPTTPAPFPDRGEADSRTSGLPDPGAPEPWEASLGATPPNPAPPPEEDWEADLLA